MELKHSATKTEIVLGRLKQKAGRLLNLFCVPGLVKPMCCYDELTESNIEIKVNELFTVFSINGKDFYFKRMTGEYGGSGIETKKSYKLPYSFVARRV